MKDEQDTLPYFLVAPPVTVLPETAKEVRLNNNKTHIPNSQK